MYIKPLVVEQSVVVMSARLNPIGSQFSILFYEICVQNHWGIKFWDPVEDSNPGGPSSIAVWVEYHTYLLFNTNIVNFVWKTSKGEAESIVLLTFVF